MQRALKSLIVDFLFVEHLYRAGWCDEPESYISIRVWNIVDSDKVMGRKASKR